MGTQIAGNTAANIMEVESATKAARMTPKPIDYGSLGIYSLAAASGTVAAGLTAASIIYSFRNSGSNIVVVKKVIISAGNTATAFAAGVCTFNLFATRSFTVSDTTNGTNITPSSNGNKLRTSMAATSLGATTVAILNTSASGITAGTGTDDTNPIGSVTVSEPATAGNTILAPTPLFIAQAGDYPLVLATSEGFRIRSTVPATGTWVFSVQVQWEELTAYVP